MVHHQDRLMLVSGWKFPSWIIPVGDQHPHPLKSKQTEPSQVLSSLQRWAVHPLNLGSACLFFLQLRLAPWLPVRGLVHDDIGLAARTV